MQRQFPLSEIDNWNTGDLIDYCFEWDAMKREQSGEKVHDNFERYQTLKNMQPEIERLYAAGQIKKAKYDQYIANLAKAKEMLGEV